jgi:hypothetical protein
MVTDAEGSGFMPRNYRLPVFDRTNAPVEITPAALYMEGKDKRYDSTTNIGGYESINKVNASFSGTPANEGIYKNISGTVSSGTGSGQLFDITIDSAGVPSVEVIAGGSNFATNSEITITGSTFGDGVSDLTLNIDNSVGDGIAPAIIFDTRIAGETLRYSGIPTTASENAGGTYINAITLLDAADANSDESVAGYNPTGFESDYSVLGSMNQGTSQDNGNGVKRNYVLINPKPIIISGVEVNDKVYDGGTGATLDFGNVDWDEIGRVSGDELDFDTVDTDGDGVYLGTFENKNVSLSDSVVQNKIVNLTNLFSGSDESNYAITPQSTAQAKILQRPVGIYRSRLYNANTAIGHTGTTSNDGGLVHTGDASVSGLVGSERLNFTVTLADKDVDGPDDDVSTRDNYITGISSWTDGVNGGIANNYKFYDDAYSFNSNYNSIAITPREVYLRVTKQYDATLTIEDNELTALSGSNETTNIVSGESLTFTKPTGSITSNDKNVVGNTWLDTDSITLADGTGGLASNYMLPPNSFSSTKNNVNITRKTLSIDNTFDVNDKTYDGTSVATISSIGNLVGVETDDIGDVVYSPGTAYFTVSNSRDKDVEGSNQPKHVRLYHNNSNLSGDESSNYRIYSQTFPNKAIITKRDITLTTPNRTKTYGDDLDVGDSFSLDPSTTYASGTYDSGDDSGSDFSESIVSVTLSSANDYDDSTTQGIGTYSNEIQISSPVAAGGFDESNYNITYTHGDLTINRREVTLEATKVYDGTTHVLSGEITIGNRANGETFSVSDATSAASSGDSKNVSTANKYLDISSITITATGGGVDTTNNYQLPVDSYNALKNRLTVTAKPLTIVDNTLQSEDKFYDGNNAANVTGGSTASLQSVVSTADNVDTDGRPVAGDDVARVFTGIKTITAQFTGGDTAPADGDFSNLIGSVAGTIGSGHQFDASISGGTPTVSVVKGGEGFATDSVITIAGSNLGGADGVNDLTITIDDSGGSGVGPTATFDDAEVAYSGVDVANKVVTYGGIAISGSASSNYSLTTHIDSEDASTGTDGPYKINPREVTLSATKIFDDSFIFDPLNPSDDDITITTATGENLTFSSATVGYDDQWETDNYFNSIVLADGDTGFNDGLAVNYTLPPMSYDENKNSVTIIPRELTITANSRTKTYGETVVFDGTEFTEEGLQGSDAITVTLTSSGTVNTADAVIHDIVPSLAIAASSNDFDLRNYNLPDANYVSGTLTVNRKALTLPDLTAVDKTYDGSDTATISSYGNLSGILSFDIVDGNPQVNLKDSSLLPSAVFSDKNVNGHEAVKTVTSPLTDANLDGSKAANYSIGDQTTDNAKILKRELTLQATKVFDGTRVIENGEITLGNYATLGGAEELVISNANSMDSSVDNLGSINVNSSNKFIDTSDSTSLSDEAGATSASGGLAANYKLPPNAYDSAKNNLTITAAPLTILADDQSKTYGDADPTLTVSYSGGATGFSASDVSGWTVSAPTNAAASVGTHSISVDVSAATADNGNYSFASPTPGTLTVNKRPITLKAQDQSKTYGDVLSLGTTAFDLTAGSYAPYASGVHTAEAATAVTLTSANGYAANTTQNQATYSDEIVIQAGSAIGDNFDINNYLITRDEGDLTINKREVTLSVTKSYDGTDIVEPSELTIGNRANGETLSTTGVLNANSKNVDGTNFLITTTNFLADGTGLASNYQLPSSSYVSGVNSVTTAPVALTITADNKTKTYGDADPSLSVVYTGFVGNDALSPTSEISGLSVSAPTGASADYGTHVITVSGAASTYGNYNITQNNGTLTVNQRPITLTATDQSKTYGDVDSLGTTAFSLTSGTYAPSEEATDVVLTTGASAYESTATANAGTYSGAIDISGATGTGGFLESNYNIDYRDGDYTVQKAALTIAADNKSKTYGATEPVLTATYTGFKNDENPSVLADLVFSAPTGSSADVGSHAISPSGATAANYDISFTDGVLTVNKATLNVTALNGSKFVTENDSAGFEGVSYSGFVLGESESDAGLWAVCSILQDPTQMLI